MFYSRLLSSNSMYYFIINFSMFCLISASVQAGGGGMDTGGGDVYSQEFAATGWQVFEKLKSSSLARDLNLDLGTFERALRETTIDSTAVSLTLRETPKDALNYLGAHRIVFSRVGWDSYSDSKRKALVVHEYLRFTKLKNGLQIDDSSYSYSARIAAELFANESMLENSLVKFGAQRFRSARVPSRDDVKLQYDWNCSEIRINRENATVQRQRRSFQLWDSNGAIRNEGSSAFRDLSWKTDGLSGRTKAGVRGILRVTEIGDLVVEYQKSDVDGVFSIYGYSYCPLSDVRRYNAKCGLAGSLDERILDCDKNKKTHGDRNWQLVMRNEDGVELVWRDAVTGLLWLNGSTSPLKFKDAKEFCESLNGRVQMSEIFQSPTEARSSAKISWRLPTVEEYNGAYFDQIEEAVKGAACPGSPYPRWTSTVSTPADSSTEFKNYYWTVTRADWSEPYREDVDLIFNFQCVGSFGAE